MLWPSWLKSNRSNQKWERNAHFSRFVATVLHKCNKRDSNIKNKVAAHAEACPKKW